MARVTVEDCLRKVPNRFELVLLASKRAKQLSMGKEPLIVGHNKATVMALREIAEGLITKENIDQESECKPALVVDAEVDAEIIQDTQSTVAYGSSLKGFSTEDDF